MEKTYRINEIFYSLQGEGRNTGRAAAFIRFAGCNLRCPFCDTDFEPYDEMTLDDLIANVRSFCHPGALAVLTGGEPSLQADERLVARLQEIGYYVTMESNGTQPAPGNIDFLTLSPKTPKFNLALGSKYLKELKLVFTGKEKLEQFLDELRTNYGDRLKTFYDELCCQSLQPCDTGDVARNRQMLHDCIAYIQEHPQWRLSLQTHKLIGVR